MAILPISLPNFYEAFKIRSLLQPFMAKAFDIAWDALAKALSTEDLRMAARTGGIQLTPERRQAYADAELPFNTGGGFRTMPETFARNLMRYQKTQSPAELPVELDNTMSLHPKYENKFFDPYFDPRHKASDYYGDYRLRDGGVMDDPRENYEPPFVPNTPPRTLSDSEQFPTSDFAASERPNPSNLAFDTLRAKREAAEKERFAASEEAKQQRLAEMRAIEERQKALMRQKALERAAKRPQGRRMGPNTRRNRRLR